MRVPIDVLQAFCDQALQQAGLNSVDAEATASVLVTTDAMGVFTHGTKLLGGYLNRLRGGGYRATGVPKIEREGPGWAIIDGDSALGQVGSMFAMRTAIAKARNVGVAYVGLRNTGHIGAAGYYASLAAREGFITQVTGNDIPSVAAPGSRGPVLGSNPFAYGVPVPGQDPILLDIATAAVAGARFTPRISVVSRFQPIGSSTQMDSLRMMAVYIPIMLRSRRWLDTKAMGLVCGWRCSLEFCREAP
jgi:ureidoglycolate dehydrogenase (NAD+)